MRLALFDFDGTLTNRDSLPDFIIYSVGRWKYYLGLVILSPMLSVYLLKFLSNDRAKELMMEHFFKGWRASDFKSIAKRYALNKIDSIIRPKALERLQYHQQNSDRIIVVSASIDAWIEPWCNLHHIELLATSMEEKNGLITGKFASKNCNGPEKCVRIGEAVDLSQYEEVFVYGDSQGDKEMLSLATHQGFYRHFH